MKKILIAESVPSSNKGEMAILAGIRRGLGAGAELALLSFRPDYDRERYRGLATVIDVREAWPSVRSPGSGRAIFTGLRVFAAHAAFALSARLMGRACLRVWRGELWRWYLDADLIVFGHDSSFGVGGDPENPIFYPLYLPDFACAIGKRSAFVAGTLPEPPRRLRGVFRRLFRRALERAASATFRDAASFERAVSWGIRQARLTADPAFLMPSATPEEGEAVLDRAKAGVGPRIGVTISRVRAEVTFPAAGGPGDSYARHTLWMASAMDSLSEKFDADIVFLPHSVGYDDSGDDRLVSRDVMAKMKRRSRAVLIAEELPPEVLKSIIGRLDLLIAERLHSAIAAAGMGVPCLALTYPADPRKGMVDRVLDGGRILPLGLPVAELLEHAVSLWARRESVGPQTRARSEELRRKAEEDFASLRRLAGLSDGVRCAT